MNKEYDMRDRNYDMREREEYDRRDYHDEPYERSSYGYYGRTPFMVTRDYRGRRDYARGRRDYARRDYRGRRDYMYDYDNGMLDDEDLKEWCYELTSDMDDKEKEYFKKERVLKRAGELGVNYDEYSPEEFYTVVVMLYKDYKKVVGTSMDSYVQMAKEWFKDPDSSLRNSEKLTAYYDYIING